MKVKGGTCRFRWDNQGLLFKETTSGMLYMRADQLIFTWIQQPSPAGLKKTGGEPDEWKKWNVTKKLCGMNSFHSNTKRMKERSKKWRVKWPTSKLKTSANVSCVRSAGSIEKNGIMSVLGSAICRLCVSFLVRRGLWHMQISTSKNWYKRHHLSIVVAAFVAAIEKDRTGRNQLKGFKVKAYLHVYVYRYIIYVCRCM